ncbi:MAG: carbohydrate binding family 9 domain-containing protein [Saprospiraceae bacterium]|nr:carbohydrate binding family 9 domain-containing protein [Saprospiraceae bacterium]
MQNVLFIILVLASPLLANDEVFEAYQLSQPINFDGWVQDDEWGDIPVLSLEMQLPNMGDTPSQLSEVRVAYDDQFVYLSGRLYDNDVETMMANTKKRDAISGSTQFFGMILDSYNDNENALAFFTTPTGIRWDGAISRDAIGGNPLNISWNAFWDVKVQRNDEGWFTEIRVPFTSLGFEDVNGDVTMGFITFRYIPRTNEVDMYPLIPPDFGEFSAWRPSMAQDILFRGVQRKRPFYITPYVLSGFSSVNDLNEGGNAYVSDNEFIRQIGGDIKFGLSKGWTLDLSVNTDFAQVEADDQQVNLTRFSLFFPEKRLFFQERSGVFNFSFGRRDQLFYSRRIGINDGEIQRIIGGARVVGRSGDWDIGLISMQTAKDGELRGENLSVLRLKRDIINERSDLGMLLTHRTDFEGNYNFNYGIDAVIEVFDEHQLSVKYAQTFDSEIENKIFDPSSSKYWLSFSTQRRRGFSHGTSISRSGINHIPGMGFQQRDNYTRFGNRTAYNWFQEGDSKIFFHGAQSGGSIHWSNTTGRIESLGWRVGWEMALKDGWRFEARLRPSIENLVEPFELSDDVTIPIGDYNFTYYEAEVSSPMTKSLTWMGEVKYGPFYDGHRSGLSFTPTFNVSPSVELSGTYEYNRASFDDRDEVLNFHLIRLKSLFMFNTQLSLATLVQYNNQSKTFLGNVRLRYNPSEGNDLFVVYNDDLNSDRFRESPVLPTTNQRSIQVKYSYTFRL